MTAAEKFSGILAVLGDSSHGHYVHRYVAIRHDSCPCTLVHVRGYGLFGVGHVEVD